MQKSGQLPLEGFGYLRCVYRSFRAHSSLLSLDMGENREWGNKIFSTPLCQVSYKMCLGFFSGNGDGMLKLIEENAEGSGQIPQLPRKKEKRDFPVSIVTLGLISLLC